MNATESNNESISSRRRPTRRQLIIGSGLIGSLGLLSACTTPPGGAKGAEATGSIQATGQEGTPEYTAAIRKLVRGKQIQVGFTPPILSEYYTQMENSAFIRMNELESLYGVNWKWEKSSPTGNFNAVEQQINTVQSWSSRKFNAVLICTGANFATMQGVYKKATAGGTNIFQFNQPIELYPVDEINAVCNIGYDNRWQSGYVAGKFIAETLHGKGKVLQIMGPPGSDWTKARVIGFNKAMSENPGIQVVGSGNGGYLRSQGLSVTQDLLTRNRDVNAIYGENEDMALGASQAVETAGLKVWDGSQGIVIIGADGLLSGMKAIQSGKLTATVDVNSVDNGRMMIDMVFQSLVLKSYVPKVFDVTTHLVTKANVDAWKAQIEGVMSPPKKY